MLEFEGEGIGINFDTWDDYYHNYRFIYGYMWLIISFWFFLILGLYFDNVLPQAFGVRKPFYYFLLPSYWCGFKNKEEHHRSEDNFGDAVDYEPVPENLKRLEDESKILRI